MKFIARVIVMDDHKPTRRLFQTKLSKANLNVEIATSVANLIEQVEADHFDASILDIKMTPNGTEGLEAIKALKNLRPDMYIEVQTAYPKHSADAYALGADLVLIKPAGYNEDAPKRIKNGILSKKLSLLASSAGPRVDEILAAVTDKTSDYETGLATISASLLAQLIPQLEAYLASHSEDFSLDESSALFLQKDVIQFIIKQLMGIEFTTNSSPSSELEDDINYQAYVQQKKSLEKQFLQKYVAFVNGELVANGQNLDELFEKLDKDYPDDQSFIQFVTRQERVLDFGLPRDRD